MKIKLAAVVSDVRQSVAEILSLPASDVADNRALKKDQKVLALWAADCAEHVLPFFEERYPKDRRPRGAIEALRRWAATGVFRMADVRRTSLAAHTAARRAKREDAIAAARAAGQAMASAHIPTHALGAAAYAIKAAAVHSGNTDDGLVKERSWQRQRLRELAGRS